MMDPRELYNQKIESHPLDFRDLDRKKRERKEMPMTYQITTKINEDGKKVVELNLQMTLKTVEPKQAVKETPKKLVVGAIDWLADYARQVYAGVTPDPLQSVIDFILALNSKHRLAVISLLENQLTDFLNELTKTITPKEISRILATDAVGLGKYSTLAEWLTPIVPGKLMRNEIKKYVNQIITNITKEGEIRLNYLKTLLDEQDKLNKITKSEKKGILNTIKNIFCKSNKSNKIIQAEKRLKDVKNSIKRVRKQCGIKCKKPKAIRKAVDTKLKSAETKLKVTEQLINGARDLKKTWVGNAKDAVVGWWTGNPASTDSQDTSQNEPPQSFWSWVSTSLGLSTGKKTRTEEYLEHQIASKDGISTKADTCERCHGTGNEPEKPVKPQTVNVAGAQRAAHPDTKSLQKPKTPPETKNSPEKNDPTAAPTDPNRSEEISPTETPQNTALPIIKAPVTSNTCQVASVVAPKSPGYYERATGYLASFWPGEKAPESIHSIVDPKIRVVSM